MTNLKNSKLHGAGSGLACVEEEKREEGMIMSDTAWFTVDTVDESTYVISEYRHPEETHCYLLCGSEKALLIDTGLGIGNIYDEVLQLTDKPIVATATHVHWDHIGGHSYFDEFYAHKAELDWLRGRFPLPQSLIRQMLVQGCDLPKDYSVDSYELFQGEPKRLLNDGDTIELGERSIRAIHTPGHAPGHLCFWDEEKQYLFTGDLIYKGLLYANYPSTDPQAYLASVKKIATYTPTRIFPAHHSPDIPTDLIHDIHKALQKLSDEHLLRHGSGRYDYDGWSILL